jgi:hypothetical protein
MNMRIEHSSTFHSCNLTATATMARYHSTPTRAAAKTTNNRQNYSLYQPVHSKTNRKSSISKNGDKNQKERDTTASRASADPVTGRRRGTMRSKEHDDEEEEFQRALEQSKRDVEGSTGGKRNGKRGRDDSDECVTMSLWLHGWY